MKNQYQAKRRIVVSISTYFGLQFVWFAIGILCGITWALMHGRM